MDIILINDDFPSENGEIPLPDWSAFDDADVTDLDEGLRAVPQPLHVAIDRQSLPNDARYDIPVTLIACEFTSDQVRSWIAQGDPSVRELSRIHSVDLIDLPTGHWPQFTRPEGLSAAILAALS
jgi:pimeloyl-ACP methyl ester carboxylesterase